MESQGTLVFYHIPVSDSSILLIKAFNLTTRFSIIVFLALSHNIVS